MAIGNLRWQFTPGPRLALTNQAYIVEGRYRNTVPDGRTRQEGLDRDVTWRGTAQFVVGSAAAADPGTSDRQTLVEVGGQAQILSAARVRRRFTTTTTTVLQDDRGYAHHAGGLAQRSMGARPTVVLTPGVRVERFTLVRSVAASPWLLAEWQASPQTTIRAGAGMPHQAPSFDQSVHPVPPAAAGDAPIRCGPRTPSPSISAPSAASARRGGCR